MSARAAHVRPEQPLWTAPALSAVAGAVDGIGYLVLNKIFTSHMSGNAVAMTIYVASARWHEASHHAEAIVSFCFGVALGLAVSAGFKRRRARGAFTAAATLEIVLLVAFILLAPSHSQWNVIFPATAMGVQNAVLRRVARRQVRTTFITGMLTNTVDKAVDVVAAAAGRQASVSKHAGDLLLYAGICASFVAGGIAGAVLDLRIGALALLLPIAGLAVLVAVDLKGAGTPREGADGASGYA